MEIRGGHCLSGLIKGPPLQREGWCVCFGQGGVCVEGQGGLHMDRLSPSSPAIINLPILRPPPPSSSSPERPKLLHPSTTHSGLNKAAPRLSTRAHTRAHTPSSPVDADSVHLSLMRVF